MKIVRRIARHPFLLIAGVALAVVCTRGAPVVQRHLRGKAAVAVPSPVYQIEATSGTHHATIGGLPIAPLGVVAAPTPVDVTGDGIPDVLVSINLVDVSGLFANPPGAGQVLAPNLKIERILPGAPLGGIPLPLRIDAKLTIQDTSGSPPTYVRLGYDTGPGGSIPNTFSLVANGLTHFFNPLQATIATTGYAGPLTLVAGIQTGTSRTDADARFSPLPTGLTFSYVSDAAGQHIGVVHGGPIDAPDGDVDLTTTVTSTASSLVARVDRLPRSVAVTLKPGSGDGTGGFDYVSTPRGRLPDMEAHYTGAGPGNEPMVADLDLVGLPSELHGTWALAAGKPAVVHFGAPNEAVGSIDATVALAPGVDHLVRRNATQRQNLTLQEGATVERLITGHIEGLRLVEFSETASGFNGHFQADGTGRPLEVDAELPTVGDQQWAIGASTTVDPLPNDVTVALVSAGADQIASPLTITYTSSSSVDVQAHAELRKPAAKGKACGATGTVCGDLRLLSIPGQIQTRVSRVEATAGTPGELRLAVDTQARPGAAPPDVIAHAVVGTATVPIVAHAEALGVPAFLRIRAVDGANGSTSLAQFNACDVDYTTDTCRGGSDQSVGALQFAIRDFVTRPSNLPVAVLTPHNSLAVVGRGQRNGTVAFEAAGRVESVAELTYVNNNVVGLRTRVGGHDQLDASIDLKGIPVAKADTADLSATASVDHVPDSFDFCIQQQGEPIRATPIHPATAACENPPGFSSPPTTDLTVSPLAVAYNAGGLIDHLHTDATFTDHGSSPSVLDAHVDIKNLPAQATLHALQQADGTIRAKLDTGTTPPPPNTPKTDITFSASHADGDLICSDPRVPPQGHAVSCLSGEIRNLPGVASVDFFPDQPTNNLHVHTDSPIELPTLDLSSVKGVASGTTTKAGVLRAHLSIPTLPTDLLGTIHPSPAAIQFTAAPPIPTIDASLATFIAPDPLPQNIPDPRSGVPAVVNPDTLSVFQRGDVMRADAHITNLSSGGYSEASNGVKIVNVGFGQGKSIRAYIDIDDGSSQVIGDATLVNLPTSITMCFRGAPGGTGPALGTFCEASAADKGAFEFRAGGNPTTPFDVYAFVRAATQAGAKVLAGSVALLGIPPIVRGEFGSGGNLTVGGYTDSGKGQVTPSPIGRIVAHVATFDLDDAGYSTLPYNPVYERVDPFPLPDPTTSEALSFAADDTNMEARVLLGQVHPGLTGAALESVSLTPDACAPYAGHTDYPQYPTLTGTPYTCTRVNFAPSGNGKDPLALALDIKKGTTRVALHHATLDNVPASLQATMSSIDANTAPPSGSAWCAPGPYAASSPCTPVPPMIRYDSSANVGTNDLAGVFELGGLNQVAALSGLGGPAGDLPDMEALPVSGWNDSGCVALKVNLSSCDQHGIRALAASIKGDTAARIAFRLPMPDDLSVDPVRHWSASARHDATNYDALDLAVRFAAKAGGADLPSLGRLDAVDQADGGSQTVITDDYERPERTLNGATVLPTGIPGELNAAFYLRDNKQLGRLYAQVDGFVNQDTTLRVRLIPAPPDSTQNPPPPPGPVVDLALVRLPAPTSADPGTPSFRVEAEVIAPPDPANPPINAAPPNPCAHWYDSASVCAKKTDIEIKHLGAVLDFHVDNDRPVRLMKAVAHYESMNGFQIQAFAHLNDTTPSARISGELFVNIDPLNVGVTGKFTILDYRVSFDSKVSTNIILDRVSDVSLLEDRNVIKVHNADHGTLGEHNVSILPDVRLSTLHAAGGIAVGPFRLDVLGVDFQGSADEPVNNKFTGCGPDDPGTATATDDIGPLIPVLVGVADLFHPKVAYAHYSASAAVIAPGDTQDFAALPDEISDPRFHLDALGFPVPLPFSGAWLPAILDGFITCESLPNPELIGLTPPLPQHPANTLEPPLPPIPGEPAPDATKEPPVAPIGPPDLTIPAGQTLRACTTLNYNNLVVAGTLRTQDATNPISLCSLKIIAHSVEIKAGGLITTGPGYQKGNVSIIADTITVDTGGIIQLHGANYDGNILHEVARNADVSLQATGSITLQPGSWLSSDGVEVEDGQGNQSTGTGGSGHGGNGGMGVGPKGSGGGQAYGEGAHPNKSSVFVEGGSAGGVFDTTNEGGLGGGTIHVAAPTVNLEGRVSANGADGASDCLAHGPGFGLGGGSGGGIVVTADLVNYNPGSTTIRPDGLFADGGQGGSGPLGGGGGGAGGVIKVLSPDDANVPAKPGGALGGNDPNNPTACPNPDTTLGAYKAGTAATDGVVITNDGPESHVLPFANFWNADRTAGSSDLKVQVRGSSGVPDGNTFTMHVCGAWVDASWENQTKTGGGGGPSQTNGLPTPTDYAALLPTGQYAPNKTYPCGVPFLVTPGGNVNVQKTKVQGVDAGIFLDLASATYSDGFLTPRTIDVNLDNGCAIFTKTGDCPNGFWALWTSVVTTTGVVEDVPAAPDSVIGIDHTSPFLALRGVDADASQHFPSETLAGANVYTSSRDVTFHLDAQDQDVGLPALSGVGSASCTESSPSSSQTVTFPCFTNSDNHYHLQTAGDGLKKITVTLTDGAGNTNSTSPAFPCSPGDVPNVHLFCPTGSTLNVFFDVRPPLLNPPTLPAPTGHNGWYLAAPPIVLHGPTDPVNTDGTPGSGIRTFGPNPPYLYRIDDFDKQSCPTPGPLMLLCTVTGFPSAGTHTLYFAAVDAVGNHQTFPGEDPQVRNLNLFLADPDPGSTTPPGQVTISVDGVAPTTALSTVPAPNANHPTEFTTDPWIVLHGFDNPGGSGLDPSIGDGIAGFSYQLFPTPPNTTPTETKYAGPLRLGQGDHTICWRGTDVAGNTDVDNVNVVPSEADYQAQHHCYSYRVDSIAPQVTVTSNPPGTGASGWFKTPPSLTLHASDAGSGVASLSVAVDGAQFAPYTGPITFGPGVHRLLWFATDDFGNSSIVREQDVNVDVSPPAVRARIVPPFPALDPWWRRGVVVAVDATDGDQSSGVASIEYQVDNGGWLPYAGPIPLAAGVHTVGYRAMDVAGWTATGPPLTVPIDDTAPTVVAGSPSPTVWNLTSGPATASLGYSVGDDRSTAVRVTVLVIDGSGQIIRRINTVSVPVTPGGPLTNGSVAWDGKDANGNRAAVGLYRYRVIGVDQAGNIAQSSESKPIQVVGGLAGGLLIHVLVDLSGL